MTGKTETFRLFKDSDVGLGEAWILDTQIESRHDDDVETDTDVYERAQNMIAADLKMTERNVRKKGWNKLVVNINMEDRVEKPENYDREAKLIVKRK